MHRGGDFVLRLLGGTSASKAAAVSRSLVVAEARTLSSALVQDAHDYYFSACVTVADAVRGLSAGLYSWATVKLYYGVFYGLRGALALDGDCLFYIKRSSFHIHAGVGEVASAIGERSTHGSVLRIFAKRRPADVLLSQHIGTDPPLDWLLQRREEANYIQPRFTEPDPPSHFLSVEREGLRKLLNAYARDATSVYTFDEDHAMLAFPIRLLSLVAKTFRARSREPLTASDLAFLRQKCRDASGTISHLIQLFSQG